MDDADLDALFAAARATPPQPSGALMDRLRDAALHAQPRPVRRAVPRRRPLAQLLDAIGGWPAMAGLASAAVAGVWIGFNPPSTVTALLAPGELTLLAPYDLSLLDEEG